MTIDNSTPNEFELSGLAAILPPEVTCLLRDQQRLIKELSERITRLEEKLERTEAKQEAQQGETDRLREVTAKEMAFDRRRIVKLENRKQGAGPKSREQINELMNYLKDCPNRVTPLEGARLHLGVSKTRLSNLLASPDAENQFILIKNQNDRRKKLIKLRPQI